MPISRDALRGLLQQAGIKKLRDTGNGFQGLCPYHANTKTPAWGMNLEGLWNCMNPLCARKGNLVTFLVEVAGMSHDAAEKFRPAEVADMKLVMTKMPPYEMRGAPQEDTKEYLPEAKLIPFRRCPGYMLDRGYPRDFLRDYNIGFDEACDWPDKVVRPAVTFPVRDHVNGRLIGFSRRAVEPDAWPPYSHEVEKTRTLYLLDRLRPGPVLVTEGPCNALTSRLRALDCPLIDDTIRAALGNAVATMGGKWSEEYTDYLRWTGRDVWFGFDIGKVNKETGEIEPDLAGHAATEKAISSCMAGGITRLFVLRGYLTDLGDLDPGQTDALSYVPSWRRNVRRL
jgi:CHC2-type zinc finger protein